MLYSEFVEGTGCRDNAHNMKVYKRLEVVYMSDESMTKEEVYEWGKKLVDNSLSEEQKEFNKKVKESIASLEAEIDSCTRDKNIYKEFARESTNADDRRYWNNNVKVLQDNINQMKAQVKWSKSCIIK